MEAAALNRDWSPATPPPAGSAATPPGPGKESVWDYPRPPAVVRDRRRVTVELGGVVVCDTTAALRVLETSHPPTWYLPVDDFAEGSLRPAAGRSFCEFKGTARYLDVLGGPAEARGRGEGTVAARCAWTYPSPSRGYEALTGHVALYPGAVDRCTVADEVVAAQEGDFYGGWVTADVVGPFKGPQGTLGW